MQVAGGKLQSIDYAAPALKVKEYAELRVYVLQRLSHLPLYCVLGDASMSLFLSAPGRRSGHVPAEVTSISRICWLPCICYCMHVVQ